MGNTLSPPCLLPKPCTVKLVFWNGQTKTLAEKCLTGELMFQFPDTLICHADSFYIGHPIPALSLDDELTPGETYFVIPIDRFACQVLSAASLTALGSSTQRELIDFRNRPFQYEKGANGRMRIKVNPEFIVRIIGKVDEKASKGSPCRGLCSTPELKKHYAQLVGYKAQPWSPKLETINEFKCTRSSTSGVLAFDWRLRKISHQ